MPSLPSSNPIDPDLACIHDQYIEAYTEGFHEPRDPPQDCPPWVDDYDPVAATAADDADAEATE